VPDRRALERTLRDVENRLRAQPASIDLRFERAQLLHRLGRIDEARLGFVDVVRRDSSHFGALNDLGRILFAAGMRNEALTCFTAAVSKHPRKAIGHANLAFMLLHGGDAAQARKHYEIAVELDPNNAETHRGLALALDALGEHDVAKQHAREGHRQPLTELPYRGEGEPIRVLLVVSAGPGNVPAERFLDDRVFAITKLVAEYGDALNSLPPHDLAFNAVGDADVATHALESARDLLSRTPAPVINAPPHVLQTGRANNARRLRAVPGAIAPRIVPVLRSQFDGATAADTLSRHGLTFPLLLRVPGFHTGMNFECVERPGDLPAVLAKLPGEELLAIEYLDVRGRDGKVRKYRAMIVDGALFPLHLAVASNWKVHYFSAEMAEHPEYRAEEEAFLTSMPAMLGAQAIAALHGVRQTLALDYGGIDFSLDDAGQVVVFEANATMAVPRIGGDDGPAYRAAAVRRIEDAVFAMLNERAGKLRPV
jgi:tetratricopeptide (TPR) repeat protein